MRREKLEQRLDLMFAEQLTSRGFLQTCIEELANPRKQDDSGIRIQRLNADVRNLRQKRERVLEAFFDGTISRDERKQRLESIDRDIQSIHELLLLNNTPSAVNLESLIKSFAPLIEWQYWTRDQKRTLLAALVPDIRVADYRVTALGIDSTLFSNEHHRTDKGSSPLPT
jgi:hypothetical protein